MSHTYIIYYKDMQIKTVSNTPLIAIKKENNNTYIYSISVILLSLHPEYNLF